MDAIRLLKQQHRELEGMFDEFEAAGRRAGRRRLAICRRIGDLLAVHAAIEEKIFYPATRSTRTAEMLREALEEHLSVKRIVADLVRVDEIDAEAEAKMTVLREQKQHHVEEEEKELFPAARKLLDARQLDDLGAQMEALAREIRSGGDPRLMVPRETEHAARI